MKSQFLFRKNLFLENKTRKSYEVKLHLISGKPVSISLVFFFQCSTIFIVIIFELISTFAEGKLLVSKCEFIDSFGMSLEGVLGFVMSLE
jgi:hypothetical protein